MTTALKKYLRRKMRSILHNQRAIAIVRNLLRPFPGLEEEVRVLAYRLNKSTKQSIARSETRQISQVKPPEGYVPQLLFDVSELAIRDIHTGIQRVVRALLLEILNHPPTGYRLHAVRADANGDLFYAHNYTAKVLGRNKPELPDNPVRITRRGLSVFCDSAESHLRESRKEYSGISLLEVIEHISPDIVSPLQSITRWRMI